MNPREPYGASFRLSFDVGRPPPPIFLDGAAAFFLRPLFFSPKIGGVGSLVSSAAEASDEALQAAMRGYLRPLSPGAAVAAPRVASRGGRRLQQSPCPSRNRSIIM